MPRKIFRPTKMQGGNIYRACKGKENIAMIFAAKRAENEQCRTSQTLYKR